jgi:hypothetical protein
MLILSLVRCKEEYVPQIEAKTTGLLVVEGFLNSGPGSTTVRLSRSSSLEDATLKPEFNAQVNIQGQDGTTFQLFETGNGEYSNAQLTLLNGMQYRLHIMTANGSEYVSDYSPVKHTPVIDSITWQRENDGVRIYVNAHDDQNETKYYRWTYSETWEFHSAYVSSLEYVRDPVTNNAIDLTGRADPDAIYKCWRTQQSTNIILGSSEKLTANKIFSPIRYIEPLAEELSVRYYIEVTQYALSHDAYLFYQRIKKNTEQIGTLFDPQPSELTTNIHCITDPGEQVLGHVEIADAQQAHIFIANGEVSPWVTPVDCSTIVAHNDTATLRSIGTGTVPVAPILLRGQAIETFSASSANCVDCTLRGTNIRPTFW